MGLRWAQIGSTYYWKEAARHDDVTFSLIPPAQNPSQNGRQRIVSLASKPQELGWLGGSLQPSRNSFDLFPQWATYTDARLQNKFFFPLKLIPDLATHNHTNCTCTKHACIQTSNKLLINNSERLTNHVKPLLILLHKFTPLCKVPYKTCVFTDAIDWTHKTPTLVDALLMSKLAPPSGDCVTKGIYILELWRVNFAFFKCKDWL